MFNKKALIVFFSFAFLIVLAGCGGEQAAEDVQSGIETENGSATNTEEGANKSASETVTLKLSSHYPPTHILSINADQYFVDKINEKTGGTIKVEYYPAEQLAKTNDMLNAVQQGSADIATIGVAYVSGQIPLSMVTALPSNAGTGAEATQVANKLLENEYIQEEFAQWDVVPLAFFTTPPYDVVTKDKPVRSLEDLKGLKLKAPGGILTKIGEPLGVIGVSIAGPEMYEAIQRGTVDGAFLSFPSTKSYNLQEVIKYHTYGANFSTFAHVYAINKKVWDSLTNEQRVAIQEAAQEAALNGATAGDESVGEIIQEFEEMGIEIYTLTDEQRSEWAKEVSPIYEEYLKSLESSGKREQAQEVLNVWQTYTEEITAQ